MADTFDDKEDPTVTRRSWNDLSDRGKTAVLVLASVQLSLAVTAWIDLVRRPASQVRGSKVVWAAVIAVNFVGPGAYFRLADFPPANRDPPSARTAEFTAGAERVRDHDRGASEPEGASMSEIDEANEIVVGLDLSASSALALHWAAAQAHRTGVRLRAVHALNLPLALGVAGIVTYPTAVSDDRVEASYREASRRCGTRSGRDQTGAWTSATRPGRPWCGNRLGLPCW